MRKNIYALLVAMVFLMLSEGAMAQANINFTMFGSPDCGQWLNQKNTTHKTWLLGFLSGQNRVWLFWSRQTVKGELSDPLDKLNSADQAFLWMDNYCRANPLKLVSNGGIDLFTELLMKP